MVIMELHRVIMEFHRVIMEVHRVIMELCRVKNGDAQFTLFIVQGNNIDIHI